MEALRFEFFLNPRAQRAAYGERGRRILDPAGFTAAMREIRSWPGYKATPLLQLSGLAKRMSVAEIFYKDEGTRFGLGSFKALGGAYAVYRVLAQEIARRIDEARLSSVDLLSGRYRAITKDITVTTATDGNHGRSVAWGAQIFGCRSVVYIHATVSEGRKAEIVRYGAEVRRVPGNYDDSVRQAAKDAAEQGWHVVSDTSYEGYVETPRDVMYGYAVMVDEAFATSELSQGPTHVFLQAGVGALAASVIARMWSQMDVHRPHFIVVEPERAACVFESLKAGTPRRIHGDLDTAMAGLAAGEVSLLAWQILERSADAAMTVSDEAAFTMMRMLAKSEGGDPPIVAGESAVAGLVGLAALSADQSRARRLGLDAQSRVLVFGTEADTDQALYAKIVGRSGDEVRARARS